MDLLMKIATALERRVEELYGSVLEDEQISEYTILDGEAQI